MKVVYLVMNHSTIPSARLSELIIVDMGPTTTNLDKKINECRRILRERSYVYDVTICGQFSGDLELTSYADVTEKALN